ncbi:hypothetical protein Misp01_51250 [Microtetraspora sp. NBRC 13810]|uniref:sensor histidine kinase n=1 Tax=Microtetraspora sp. NBRC 13810 TaxID=3030990 RepID=UPI0024A01207|nr:nitrate- and nitrite sensing domain-containing protein [Microtetraspora sp. NBRC 13810]GLW09996.1 hypothetical protein Misp01_51250 [Microtetraspora sp. NBRC 13810]
MASGRSIRFKICVLLAAPLVTLIALWGFAAHVTTDESVDLLTVGTLHDSITGPAAALTAALSKEHLLTAEYLGTHSERGRVVLAGQRAEVDRARTRLRDLSAGALASLTPAMRTRFDDLTKKADRLDTVRAAADNGRIGQVALAQEFGQVPDAARRLAASMAVNGDATLVQESRGVTALTAAEDLLGRERALAAGALVANRRLSRAELRVFGRLAANRAFLVEQGVADLEPDLRALFAPLLAGPVQARFGAAEERLLAGDPRGLVSHAEWRTAADRAGAVYRDGLAKAATALTARARPTPTGTFARAGLAGAVGLVGIVVSLVVALRVGRGLAHELAALRAAAQDLAGVRLPRVVERLSRGEAVDVAAETPALEPLGNTREVHDVAIALDRARHTAVEAAVGQATLRETVGQAFSNLARRSQSLVQRQLRMLDDMQRRAEDPEALDALFRLDHLTTRMRRHAEGLIILSGGSPGRAWRRPVLAEDTLRAAVAEVEDYTRVRIYPMPGVTVAGGAVADLVHLFAELIENAAVFSPPNTEVSVRGERAGDDFTVQVEDRGLGLTPEEVAEINRKLETRPEFDLSDTDRLGLVVVGRLAAKHGLRVEFGVSPFGGTTVTVVLPHGLIEADPDAGPEDEQELVGAPGGRPEEGAGPG